MSEPPKPRKPRPRLLGSMLLIVGIIFIPFGYYGNSFFAKWFGFIVRGQLGFVWIGVSFFLLGIGQLIWPLLPPDSPESGSATPATSWRTLPLFWKVWVVLSVVIGALAAVACVRTENWD